VAIPPEYHGREQSYLKHQFLREYLRRWGHKIASLGRSKRVKIWYVDCFAGPWRSEDEQLSDTSIHIGLSALSEAAETWRKKQANVDMGAIFVEKSPTAFRALRAYLDANQTEIDCQPFQGEFGDHVDRVANIIGDDPAFIFVDPTGFKGAAMRFIPPLVRRGPRDVLINVMFNDINRFKDDPRQFLRRQLGDFFGVKPGELPPQLSEEDLMAVYRDNLKRATGLCWVADAAVPHPTHDRTKFRLVIGGRVPAVLSVFREAEATVLRDLAALVRTEARQRRELGQTGQGSLFDASDVASERDSRFSTHEETAVAGALERVTTLLRSGPRPWREIWPSVLEALHLPLPDLARIVLQAHRRSELHIEPAPGPRRTTIEDNSMIRLGRAPATPLTPDPRS
jgi:three-Cys-motif partner protein